MSLRTSLITELRSYSNLNFIYPVVLQPLEKKIEECKNEELAEYAEQVENFRTFYNTTFKTIQVNHSLLFDRINLPLDNKI